MAGFGRDVNMNPNEIPRMPLDQKRDCMVEIDKVRSVNWKYSVIVSVGIFAFVMGYSIISTMYTLKTHELLTAVDPIIMLIPFVVIITSLMAHSMSKGRIILTIFAYFISAIIAVCTGEVINGWLAVPCLVGSVIYYGMLTLCDSYEALSKEEGFPEFFDIASNSEIAKGIIERSKPKEEPLNPLTEMAISAEKKRREKEEAAEKDDKE